MTIIPVELFIVPKNQKPRGNGTFGGYYNNMENRGCGCGAFFYFQGNGLGFGMGFNDNQELGFIL